MTESTLLVLSYRLGREPSLSGAAVLHVVVGKDLHDTVVIDVDTVGVFRTIQNVEQRLQGHQNTGNPILTGVEHSVAGAGAADPRDPSQ